MLNLTFKLQPDSAAPLYRQLYEALAGQIRAGTGIKAFQIGFGQAVAEDGQTVIFHNKVPFHGG